MTLRAGGALIAALAAAVTVIAVPSAHAQSPKCLAEAASASYDSAAMTIVWSPAMSPCTTGRATADVQVEVSVRRCDLVQCTTSRARRHCVGKRGTCSVKLRVPHPAVEAAQYADGWHGSASSSGETKSTAGGIGPKTPGVCVTVGPLSSGC